jgi:protein involved in polysaccharide export with SLBB domain
LAGTAAKKAAFVTNSGGVGLQFNLDTSYVLDSKHILEPGDHLSFRIVEDRDPAIALVVADSRELDVPYVGRVSTANKTCKQLADELKVLLEKEYYYRATVILGVDMVNKIRGKIYVQGEVRSQGPIELLFNEKLTASQAILKAGGFGDFARKDKVKVIRGSRVNAKGEKESLDINMIDVLEKGKMAQDVELEPDDFVMVPKRNVVY